LEDEVSSGLVAAWANRSRNKSLITLFVRLILILGGAAVATIAQFYAPDSSGHLTEPQHVGITGGVLAALGGIWLLATEHGTEAELLLAAKAKDEARAAKIDYDALDAALLRKNSAYEVGRTVADTVAAMLEGFSDAERLAASLLESAARDLSIAAGFKVSDTWTIEIYRAHTGGDGRRRLVPVHVARSLQGSLEGGRSWDEGEGFPGVVLAQGTAFSIADMQSSEHDGMYLPHKGNRRSHDPKRYRSALGLPIRERSGLIWGVLVGTSDTIGHFRTNSGRREQHDTPIRDFAQLVALALALREALGSSDDEIVEISTPGHD
jgi:hypothetical protein